MSERYAVDVLSEDLSYIAYGQGGFGTIALAGAWARAQFEPATARYGGKHTEAHVVPQSSWRCEACRAGISVFGRCDDHQPVRELTAADIQAEPPASQPPPGPARGENTVPTVQIGHPRDVAQAISCAGPAPLPQPVPEVVTTYRSASGQVSGFRLRAPDGAGLTVSLRHGRAVLSGADPDVWAYPERYSCERYFCPGHNGHVCYYGADDEIRYTGPLPGVA